MKNIKTQRLDLVFANLEDRKLIFDMLTSKETSHFMFDEDHPAPSWTAFLDEDASYYSGQADPKGSYLLIQRVDKTRHENEPEDGPETIGSISYACEYDKKPYAELDIWMKSLTDTGKGFGTEAIRALIDFLHETYDIKDFLIRPWIKNENAIKAYKKCGFEESKSLKIEDYYSDEAFAEYGEGDYGIEETVNLYLKI